MSRILKGKVGTSLFFFPSNNAAFLGFRTPSGQKNKSFQDRHCVLLPDGVMYFKKKFDQTPRGTIKFETGCMVIQESAPPFTFSVVLGGTAVRKFVLTAASQAECDAWVASIKVQLQRCNSTGSAMDRMSERFSAFDRASELVSTQSVNDDDSD